MTTRTQKTETATFAGGCFWCVESAFAGVEGVLDVVSGYTGGHVDQPTYEQVCSGKTGHLEAVQVFFDPTRISYTDLLKIFFQQIDPTDNGGSFVDRGSQYRSAIFYHSDGQLADAVEIIGQINGSGAFEKPVATGLIPATNFYEAESYHQAYHRTNPMQYRFYRAGSGRDRFVEKNRVRFNKIFTSARPEKGTG